MNISFKPLQSLLLGLCTLVLLTSPSAAQSEDTDAYGGSTRVKLEATGWFRLQQHGGRLWLVTPDGMLKQGLLQRNGEPYPDLASQIATFNRQTLDALYNGLKS